MKKFFLDHWDELVVYLLAFSGIMLAFIKPVFELGYSGGLRIQPEQMLFGAGIAVIVTLASELWRTGVSAEAARKGKKKNMARRFLFAIAGGYFWPEIMGKVLALITVSLGG